MTDQRNRDRLTTASWREKGFVRESFFEETNCTLAAVRLRTGHLDQPGLLSANYAFGQVTRIASSSLRSQSRTFASHRSALIVVAFKIPYIE